MEEVIHAEVVKVKPIVVTGRHITIFFSIFMTLAFLGVLSTTLFDLSRTREHVILDKVGHLPDFDLKAETAYQLVTWTLFGRPTIKDTIGRTFYDELKMWYCVLLGIAWYAIFSVVVSGVHRYRDFIVSMRLHDILAVIGCPSLGSPRRLVKYVAPMLGCHTHTFVYRWLVGKQKPRRLRKHISS